MQLYRWIILPALVITLHTQAQVWTLPAKGSYTSISYTGYSYRQAINAASEIIDLPVHMQDKTIKLFSQFGITKNLTLQLVVPYRMVASTGDLAVFNSYQGQYLETGGLNGFGNIELGGIYRVVNDKPMISVSLLTEANSVSYNYLTGLQTGYRAWTFKPGLGAGWGFDKSWLSFYLGSAIRTHQYSSAILSNLEFGYKPVHYFYTAANLQLNKSLMNGESCDCNNQYTMLYMNDQQFLAMTVKAGFIVKGWGIDVGFGGGIHVDYLPVALVPTLGISYKKE